MNGGIGINSENRGFTKRILSDIIVRKSLIGTSSASENLSEPRTVQGGGGTGVKITREWNGERRRMQDRQASVILRSEATKDPKQIPLGLASKVREIGANRVSTEPDG